MNLLSVVIESERLKLVPTSDKYAQHIFKEFSDELTVFMHPKPAKKIEETLKEMKESNFKLNEAMYSTVLKGYTDVVQLNRIILTLKELKKSN